MMSSTRCWRSADVEGDAERMLALRTVQLLVSFDVEASRFVRRLGDDDDCSWFLRRESPICSCGVKAT